MKNNHKELARQSLKLYWQHAWRYKPLTLGLLFIMPLTIFVTQTLPPLVIASILERLNNGDFTPDKLWESFGPSLLLYAAIIYTGGVVLWRIIILLIWNLEMRVLRDIHQRIFKHMMHLSANFHSNRFGGSLVSQSNKFAGSYIRVADTTIFQVMPLILSFVFSSIVLLPRAPWVVSVLIATSLVFIVLAVFVTRHIRRLTALEAAASNRQTGFLADAITNVMAVKSFAGSGYEEKRYAQATEDSRSATKAVMWASTKRDIFFGGITTSLDIAAVSVAVATVVLFGADPATIFLVVAYTTNITRHLWEFSQSTLRNYNRSIGDARDMTEILQLKPEVQDPAKPQQSRIKTGTITIKNMTFAHPEATEEHALFRNLNLQIKPGEKIGLVGHSGSGKTSLTRLLLRFHDLDSGEILIDGQNIAKITQDDLRQGIAYVPQEPLLFHRSIRENIAYGRPEASEAEIIEAAKKANAHEFIEKIPTGYDTLVGERGVKLSGGQRQRIAIARAILKDAPILVLDEATSALDSESEVLIQSALWELMKGRTAIVIAHRLSTIQKMDRIIVLEEGEITEQGSHTELVKQNGTYAGLWAHQSGGFIEE